jgi:hypothetical protein
MPNRTTSIIVVAILVIAFATVVVASTLSDGSRGAAHSMPDGSTMKDGEMP